MADLELTYLSPLVAKSLNLLLQVAKEDARWLLLSSSSWGRIQADARLQNLDRSDRLALAAALMEHGQAIVNQTSSDVFDAMKPYQEVWPGEEDRGTLEAAHAAADRARDESVFCFEVAAKVVKRRYYDEDDGLDQEMSYRASEQAHRLKYEYERMSPLLPQSRPFRLDFETVIVGFAALKVLGPFAEAFAKKLGELLAERTVTAIDRIHVIRRNGKPQLLKIEVPAGQTILVLPEDLSDDAILAIRDLPLTAPPGTPQHWNHEESRWEVQPDAGGTR